LYEGDVGCAIWRILYAEDSSRNILTTSLEVNESQTLSHAATTVTSANSANVVATGMLDPMGRQAWDDTAFECVLRRSLQEMFKLLLLGQSEGP
jgi:hypothetical protein